MENNIYVLAQCDVMRVFWICLFVLHLGHISFINSFHYLAIVVHANNKFSTFTGIEDCIRVIIAIVVVIKRVWEARCDYIFDRVQVDVNRIV